MNSRPTAILLQITAALALTGGCEPQSGILVAISGNSVDELELLVGVERGGHVVLDPEASGARYDVRGRNLRASPYEHLLKDAGGAGEAPLVTVVAVGRSEGQDRFAAVTDPPQPFLADELVRRNLGLFALDDNASLHRGDSGCVRLWHRSGDESKHWVLSVGDDLDCDGFRPPEDCDDGDPQVRPGATELCDGKDNNCDGTRAPGSQVCYKLDGGVCRMGQRSCNDAAGGSGLADTCQVSAGDPPVDGRYCWAYGVCFDYQDPLGCVEQKLGPLAKGTCQAQLTTASSTVCGGAVQLPRPAATTCVWRLADVKGWALKLSDGKGTEGETVSSCNAVLKLSPDTPPGSGKPVLELKLNGADWIGGELDLAVTPVDTCGANGLTCNFE